MTEEDDAGSRVSAGICFLRSGGGDQLRAHYLWTLDQVMGHLRPEDLSTPTLVSLLAVLIPEHSRFLIRPTPLGPKGAVLRIVRDSSTS